MDKEYITESSKTMIDVKNNSKSFFKKSKKCNLCSHPTSDIDYKNPELLKKFISEGGRILPSRITNVCAKRQRLLKKAIKLSRVIGLLPFVFTRK